VRLIEVVHYAASLLISLTLIGCQFPVWGSEALVRPDTTRSSTSVSQSSHQAHAPLRQPCRQRIIAEQQPALAETRRQWTVTRINRRPESLLRHAERAGDLSDSEVSGHNDGRRWHRAADIPGDPVTAPDAREKGAHRGAARALVVGG